MAQNFNNNHGAAPSHQPNGYEDLMGSLKSPGLAGPAAPFQQPGFATPQWPMLNWQQNPSQGNFPYSISSQMSPVNQISWTQNGREGYVPFSQEDDDDDLFTVDDTELVGQNGQQHSSANVVTSNSMQIPQSGQQVHTGQLASLSSSSPLTLPPQQAQAGIAPGLPSVPVSPKANNAATTARAAELRAKLLASRGPKAASRQASPAVKMNALSDAKKVEPLNGIKQAYREPQSDITQQGASAAAPKHTFSNSKTGNDLNMQPPLMSPKNSATSLNGAIDNLMADARNAVDAQKPEAPLTNGKHAGVQHTKTTASAGTGNVKLTGSMTQEPAPGTSRNRSASELSEPGEIRSGAATPTPAEQPESSKTSDNSRAMQDTQDKQEKLARQNEVNKAYQPLKKPKAHKTEQKGSQAKVLPPPKQSPAQTQKQNRKSSFEKRVGDNERPLIPDESRREEHRERARDYDRRDEYRDSRRTSISEAYPSPYDLERDVAARRQKLTEDNSRRAAEYKRELGTQRARQSALDSKSAKENRTREIESKIPLESVAADTDRRDSIMSDAPTNTEMQIDDSVDRRQGVDTVMLSPQAQPVEGNEDVNDWLELTEFYDDEYREKRLELFRRKKALDIQREEIEREEQMQLQERTLRSRAPSILPSATSSPATRRPSTVNVRMPPPPLPLRQANNDVGIKIKNLALSASLPASQTSSPALKRQHAEDDTETRRTQSMDKRARLDVNGLPPEERPLTSPASARGERASFKGEPVPLESRISRYDDWPPPRGRPRGRSPDFRRRSLSPRRRRYSQDYSPGPPPGRFRDYSAGARRPNDPRTCFNCGQHGHYHGQCTEPRRDGRDWQPAPKRYEQSKAPTYISPNYLGKNPQANPPKSRVNSVSKIEEV